MNGFSCKKQQIYYKLQKFGTTIEAATGTTIETAI